MKVFVYGTLKRGFPNHRVMQHAKAEFIGEATLAGFTMLDLGPFPALIQREGKTPYGELIRGEVYEVADIGPLDRLEGYPSFYNRKNVVTEQGDLCWVYFQDVKQLTGRSVVTDGTWIKGGNFQPA